MLSCTGGPLQALAIVGLFLLQATTATAQNLSWCSTSTGNGSTGRDFQVLPMGASIVYGEMSSDGNGFRKGLRDRLLANGTSTTLLGTQQYGNMTDNYMEAFPGHTIDEVNALSYDDGSYDMGANIVLLLVGTDDCWYSPQENRTRAEVGVAAAVRFAALLDSVRVKLPDALVLPAELIRNTNDWEDECIVGFNGHLPTVVQNASTKGQTVQLVEMYNVVPTDQIGSDGTHPTDHGYELMAQQWYAAFINATENLCAGYVQSTSTASATATATATGSATTSGTSASATSKSSAVGSLSLPANPLWLSVPLAVWALGA